MYIFIDLDNTLLNDMGKLTDRTIETIKKCKQLGHKIVINTARSLYRSMGSARAIDADFINCAWGNLVADSQGNVLHEKTFSKAEVEFIIDTLATLPVTDIGAENKDFSCTASPETAKKFNTRVVAAEEISSLNLLKIFITAKKEDRFKIIEKVNEIGFDINYPREDLFCTILPKNSMKCNGVKLIMDKYAKHGEKTMAFGDDLGDLDTLKHVDFPVAMGNSVPEILATTKLIAKSNHEDGVADFLEEFFQLEKQK